MLAHAVVGCLGRAPPASACATARDVMRRASRVVSAPPDMTMGELGALLERNDHRSCPVISKKGGRDGTDLDDDGRLECNYFFNVLQGLC